MVSRRPATSKIAPERLNALDKVLQILFGVLFHDRRCRYVSKDENL